MALVLPCQMLGVLEPGAGFAGAVPVVVTLPGNMGIDIVDAEHERLKQHFDGLLCQDAELIVAIQPAAFLVLAAGLANLLVCIEIAVHGAFLQIHAGHH